LGPTGSGAARASVYFHQKSALSGRPEPYLTIFPEVRFIGLGRRQSSDQLGSRQPASGPGAHRGNSQRLTLNQAQPDRTDSMYVFRPKGICPKEIHLSLNGPVIEQLRLVGGGCPGNSRLVERLMSGRSIDEVRPLLEDIQCRNGTSCPAQLWQMLVLVKSGQLQEAEPITPVEDERQNLRKVAVISDIKGNVAGLRAVLAAIKTEGIEATYSLGNLVGPEGEMDAVIELASQKNIRNVQGPNDREVAESAAVDRLRHLNRDRLFLNPLILTFHLGERRAVAFHGGFIQALPGFSDFSPYATEIIMTCNLSDYLRDESVFPALTTMTDHFMADLVLFGHTGQWKHVRLGKVDFVNVGALADNERLRFAILAWQNSQLEVEFRSLPLSQ
jgi:uncharacterized protein (TIGR03905 family)